MTRNSKDTSTRNRVLSEITDTKSPLFKFRGEPSPARERILKILMLFFIAAVRQE